MFNGTVHLVTAFAYGTALYAALSSRIAVPPADAWLFLGIAALFPVWLTVAWTNFRALVRLLKTPVSGPSMACKDADVVVDGDRAAILDQCTYALRTLGAALIAIDGDAGKLHAHIGRRFYLVDAGMVDMISVCIQTNTETRSTIHIESDGIRPTLMSDQRRHMRQVSQFIDQLIQPGSCG